MAEVYSNSGGALPRDTAKTRARTSGLRNTRIGKGAKNALRYDTYLVLPRKQLQNCVVIPSSAISFLAVSKRSK